MKIRLLEIFLSALVLGAGAAFVTAQAASDPKYKGSYREVRDFLAGLERVYPDRAQVFLLGISDSGQMIEGVKVGAGPVRHLVVATHHGNEYGSTAVAKAFAESVAKNPIPGKTLYVIPVLNVSGYEQGLRWESAKGRRFDPNRDYPGPCGTEGPFHLKSTAALAEFIATEGIVASATLHTYFPAVVYPWGFSTHDISTEYDALFIQLAKSSVIESRYPVGNSMEVIYPADGTFEDYAFWKHGIWSLIFELGYSHSPDAGSVAEMVRVNVPGLRRMMEQAPESRAEKHEFTGACDYSLRSLDRHDE